MKKIRFTFLKLYYYYSSICYDLKYFEILLFNKNYYRYSEAFSLLETDTLTRIP